MGFKEKQKAGPNTLAGRRPHVAIVCPGLGAGGSVADVALHHAQVLSDSFRLTLISDSFPDRLAPAIEPVRLRAPRFRWLRRFSHVPAELAFAYAARQALFRHHVRTGIDAVICHGHVAAHLAAQPFSAASGVPAVLVVHGDIFERPLGTYDPRLTWLYKKVTPPAYRKANLVVAISPAMRDLAIRGGAAPERVALIPNGIDPADIGIDPQLQAEQRLAPSTARILYVGRLAREKGLDTLLESCALLRTNGIAFRLEAYGDGPLRDSLQRRTRSLDLRGCVFFRSAVPRRLLGRIYKQADLVCVPSRSDSLPTVVLEAMICGLPVVGCAAGGIPFLIGGLADEVLVEPGDAAGLADRLAHFITHPEERTRVAAALQARARDEFNWRKTGARLSRELAALVASRTVSL